jgi:hypothetical protein
VFLAAVTAAIGLGTAQVFAAAFDPDPRRAAAAFVKAVNRGDWAKACGMYSSRYLKVPQANCRSLWYWGWKLYGPYRYVVVRAERRGDRYGVALICRGRPDFVVFAREGRVWRVVAGAW